MTQAEINNNFWDTFKLIWVGVALLALTALLIAFAYFSPAILAIITGFSLVVGFPLMAITGMARLREAEAIAPEVLPPSPSRETLHDRGPAIPRRSEMTPPPRTQTPELFHGGATDCPLPPPRSAVPLQVQSELPASDQLRSGYHWDNTYHPIRLPYRPAAQHEQVGSAQVVSAQDREDSVTVHEIPYLPSPRLGT